MKQLYEKLVDDLVSETGFDSNYLQRRVWDYFDRGATPITGWGGHLVTLCGNLDSTPFNLYLLHITDYDDKPRCYVGVCDSTEEDVFETVY